MAQNIILKSDVPGLGQVGDKCKVKNGYALNYLYPQGLAVLATKNAINKADRQRGKLEAQREKQLTDAKAVAEKLSKVGLEFHRPVGLGGRLFGSVTPLDIMTELGLRGAKVEKRSVLMPAPIRVVGDHAIRVRVHSQVIVDIPIKVIGKEQKSPTEIVDEAEAAVEKKEKSAEESPPTDETKDESKEESKDESAE